MLINYIIASWDGDRHGHLRPWYPILDHLEKLNNLKLPIISQITVGCPRWNNEDPKCIEKLKEWNTCSSIPVIICDVENRAQSYSQYSQMFGLYPDFDYYIMAEDDFIPVLHKFDSVLIKLFEDYKTDIPNLGFLCGLERKGIAIISNGIASREMLSSVWDRHGCLPYTGYNPGGPQVIFSRGLTSTGYSISGYSAKYRSLYWEHKPRFSQYGNGPDIWIPCEYKHNSEVRIRRLAPNAKVPGGNLRMPWEH